MSVSGDLSQQIISQAWTKAESLLGDLDWRLDRAETSVSASVGIGTAATTPLASIAEPNILIPYEASGPDLTIFNQYNTQIMGNLVTLFRDFIAEYFPMDNATLSHAETKIQSLLTTGGTGVNALVEAQIWERDRSRILSDAARAADEAVSMWAGKRFPIPPGALQNQTLQIQQKAQDELAKSSRDVAIKTFEVEVEMIKFAIDEAVKLRQVAVSAAGDYIKSIASSQNTSYQMSMGKSQAQNGLISATASFLNARTGAEDTVFKSKLLANEVYNKANIAQAQISGELVKTRGQITVSAADTVGRAAASMLNNLHTSVGVQGKEDL
ncbi:MAG TPA: hypothetical protein PLI90_08300 [Rhodocyclaceae bacterium]|nr:hypothetical protein [Rhodocyclaceae bacterium]